MTHGLPDGALSGKATTVFGLMDMAELAVRLGSPVSYDRQGNVIYLDSFIRGLSNWATGGAGAGNKVEIHNAPQRTKGGCLVLYPGQAANGWASIIRYLPLAVKGGLGMEFSFIPNGQQKDLDGRLSVDDGIKYWKYQFSYDHEDGTLSILTPGDVWEIIGTPGIRPVAFFAWNSMKVVVDTINHKYKRLLFNEHCYDISAYSPDFGDPTACTHLRVEILGVNKGAFMCPIYVDDVIITQNEPV